MDIKELYKAMQAVWVEENNIKTGSEVKILRVAKYEEMGWNLSGHDWDREQAKFCGDEILRVTSFLGTSIYLKSNSGLSVNAPFFILEVVKKPEKMIEVCGNESLRQ